MAYGTRRFNAAFTRALEQYLSWAEWIQFLVLIPISLRCILVVSSHLCLGLPKSLFPVKILKALLLSSILATCHAHLNLLDYIIDTICKQLNWCGHVQRMDQERLPRRILEWCPPGRRRKGRSRNSWMQELLQEWEKGELATWNGSRYKINLL